MHSRYFAKSGVILSCFVAFSLIMAFSSAMSADAKKGNQAKGKYYFRQTCKTCHSKGQPGGEVTPMSKTMAQWKKYFDAAKHNKGSEALTKVMPADQITDVAYYLVEHAADSLQPETCGK